MCWITQMAAHTTINIETSINIKEIIGLSEEATKSLIRNNRIRQIGSCNVCLYKMKKLRE